jgi:tetratricopeptide (TPR) repeat protein
MRRTYKNVNLARSTWRQSFQVFTFAGRSSTSTMATIKRALSLLSVLSVRLLCSCLIRAQDVPADLLQKAAVFVQDNAHLFDDTTIQQLKQRDIHTLYQVAKSMNEQDPVTSVKIWHSLADSEHILSQVALGFAYAENDKHLAIAYFVQAGENGPHQAALYNAGRLLAEQQDYTKALAYMRAAATLADTNPTFAKPQLTNTSRKAYEALSKQIMTIPNLSLQDADMFLYANISDFPAPNSKQDKIWRKAMHSLQTDDFKAAGQHFEKLQSHPDLSGLQSHLLKALLLYVTRSAEDEL